MSALFRTLTIFYISISSFCLLALGLYNFRLALDNWSFKVEVKAFYIKSLKYMKTKFPLVLITARFLDPTHRLSDVQWSWKSDTTFSRYHLRIRTVRCFIHSVSILIIKLRTISQLIQNRELTHFGSNFLAWETTQMHRYSSPNSALLLCNCYSFRIATAFVNLFNMVKQISDFRSSLGKSREGCGNTSVFAETTGIGNTLCLVSNENQRVQACDMSYMDAIGWTDKKGQASNISGTDWKTNCIDFDWVPTFHVNPPTDW